MFYTDQYKDESVGGFNEVIKYLLNLIGASQNKHSPCSSLYCAKQKLIVLVFSSQVNIFQRHITDSLNGGNLAGIKCLTAT